MRIAIALSIATASCSLPCTIAAACLFIGQSNADTRPTWQLVLYIHDFKADGQQRKEVGSQTSQPLRCLSPTHSTTQDTSLRQWQPRHPGESISNNLKRLAANYVPITLLHNPFPQNVAEIAKFRLRIERARGVSSATTFQTSSSMRPPEI